MRVDRIKIKHFNFFQTISHFFKTGMWRKFSVQYYCRGQLRTEDFCKKEYEISGKTIRELTKE